MDAEKDLNREIEEILNSSLTIDANDDDLEVLGNDERYDYKSDYEIDFENDNEITPVKANCQTLCTPLERNEKELKSGRIRNNIALDPILGNNDPPLAPIFTEALPGTMPDFNRARVKSVYCMRNLEEDRIIHQSFWCKGDTFNIDCRNDSDFWRDPDFYQKMIYLSGQRMIRTWPMEMLDRARIKFDGKCIGSSYEWKSDNNRIRHYFVPMNSIPVKMALRPIPLFTELKGYAKVSDFSVHWEISYLNNTVCRKRESLYNPEMRLAEGIKFLHHNPAMKNNDLMKIETLIGLYNDYAKNLELKRINEISNSPDLVVHDPNREPEYDPYMPAKDVAKMKWTNSDCVNPFEISRSPSPDSQASRNLKSQNSNISATSDDSRNSRTRDCSAERFGFTKEDADIIVRKEVLGIEDEDSDSNDVNSTTDQYKTDSQDSIDTARMKKRRKRNKHKKKKMEDEDFRVWLNEKKAQKWAEIQRTREKRVTGDLDTKIKSRTDFIDNSKECRYHDSTKRDHYFQKGWESPSKKTFHKSLAFTNPEDKNSYTYSKPKPWKQRINKDN